jgi:hypothetical protein
VAVARGAHQDGLRLELDRPRDCRHDGVDDRVAEAVGSRPDRGATMRPDVESMGQPLLIAVACAGKDHQSLAEVGDRLGVLVTDRLVNDVRGPARAGQGISVVVARERLEQLVVQEPLDVAPTGTGPIALRCSAADVPPPVAREPMPC